MKPVSQSVVSSARALALTLLSVAAISLIPFYPAKAQTFTLIADNQTPVPDGTGTFTAFYDNRALENGKVAFIGVDSAGKSGIYLFRNGQLRVIANTNTMVPGTTSFFSTFNDVDIDGPTIAFTGAWSNNQGVFLRRLQPDSLKAWATTLTTGKKYFQGLSFRQHKVTVTGGNQLVDSFLNHSESVMAIPRMNQAQVLVDTTTQKPGGGTFVGYDQTIKLTAGGLLFTEIIPNTIPTAAGIYELAFGSNNIVLVANQQTPVPDGTGSFQGYLGVDWDGDEVAFSGLTSRGAFLYAASSPSSVRVIVDFNTPVPGESANFLGVANPVAYEGGTFVFEGFWNGGDGLFTSQDGVIEEILRSGDQLSGRTVSDAFCYEGGKDGNQLLIRVLFTDFSNALYLVDLD